MGLSLSAYRDTWVSTERGWKTSMGIVRKVFFLFLVKRGMGFCARSYFPIDIIINKCRVPKGGYSFPSLRSPCVFIAGYSICLSILSV